MTSGKNFLRHKRHYSETKTDKVQHVKTKNFCFCKDTIGLSAKISHQLGAAGEQDGDLKANSRRGAALGRHQAGTRQKRSPHCQQIPER